MTKIVLASDHAGFKLKEVIEKYLRSAGYATEDMGNLQYEKTDDYPDYIIPAAKKVAANKEYLGIIFGGSGQGEAMAANRVKGVRATVYYGGDPSIITLSKTHNNANILSFGARFIKKEEAIEAVETWLNTAFKDEERHKRRIKKLDKV